MSASSDGTSSHSRPDVLLGHLADRLADGSLPDALGLLVEAFGIRSAVLRAPGAGLLAVAGDVVHAVPATRPPGDVDGHTVELPVAGPGGYAAATLTVVGARPSHLPGLRAAACVIGLALRVSIPRPGSVDDLLLDGEQDQSRLADGLHDGPVQALVGARYAADAAVRGGSPVVARDAVQEALVALRRAMWHVRPRGGDDLPAALQALSSRLVEAGQQPLHLIVDLAAAAALPPAARVTAYRLVQAVSGGGAPVRVAVRWADTDVLVDVDASQPLPEPDRWRRRLQALGGDLSSSAGRLRLVLPVRTPTRLPATPAGTPSALPRETQECP